MWKRGAYDKVGLPRKDVMYSDARTRGRSLGVESMMRSLPKPPWRRELTASSKIHSPSSPSLKLLGDGEVSPCPSTPRFERSRETYPLKPRTCALGIIVSALHDILDLEGLA